MAVDEHVAHGKILRKADHCVVDGSVAVRMVPAKDVADAGRRFFEGLIRSQAIFVHGVQNTPVNRLEAIAHVGKRSSDDDRHCVVNIRRLHLLHELGLYNRLFGEHDVLGLIIFLMCHRLVSFWSCRDLNVEIYNVPRVFLDEFFSGLDLFSHEDGEDLVGRDRVV